VDRESILGRYCPLIVHGTEEPFEGCPLEEAAAQNIPVEREIFDKKTGRWVRSAIYPTRIRTPGGKKVFLHVVLDITERHQAQEQLLISHEQLRRLSAHLESVREAEKRQIARNLHDETSQVLASLYAHLETAIGTLPEDAEKTREILKKAQVLSTTILDEIHKLIHDLRPVVLDRLGLVAACSSLIDNHLKVTGLQVKFNVIGKIRRLTSDQEISLFRAIQEVFNNIVKHAHARHVDMVLNFQKNAVRLHIKDDGIGFDINRYLTDAGQQRGMGLIGMRERVELMNGTLTIDSSPGRGTEVNIFVPIEKDTADGKN
jgi:signal transduction histidine kinase